MVTMPPGDTVDMLALAPLVTAHNCGPGPYAVNAAGADAAAAVGVVTTIGRLPAVVSSEAGMVASRVVGPTNVFVRIVAPMETMDVEKKFVPVMVTTVAAAPASTPGGQIPPGAIVGTAAATLRVTLTATLLLAALEEEKAICPV